MAKLLQTRFDEIMTNAPVGIHIMGKCPAEIHQVILVNGGHIRYVDQNCCLQRTPDERFTLTGLYLGEVAVEWWKEKQAEKVMSMLSANEKAPYYQIEDRQMSCYTLKNGQRLLHIQNRANGWESYLVLISHTQYAGGLPTGF